MLKFRSVLWFAATFFLATSIVKADEPFGPINVDGGKETCSSLSGTELKKSQRFEATADRFFDPKSISVRMISGRSLRGPAICRIENIEEKEITVKLSTGANYKMLEPFAYTVHVYADCGTNPANIGKTIMVECETSANLVEFTK